MNSPLPALWLLNWKEWEIVAQTLEAQLPDAFLERIYVPERSEFPERYIKGEWIFEFGHHRGTGGKRMHLWLSMRHQKTALALLSQAPKPCSRAPLPPWLQKAQSELRGQKLVELKAFDQDRILRLAFTDLALILSFIPARPEGRLEPLDWKPAKRSDATSNPPVRVQPSPAYAQGLWQSVNLEGHALRVTSIQKECKERLRKLGKLARKSAEHAPEPGAVTQFVVWADLLLTHAHQKPKPQGGAFVLRDLESQEEVRIPVLKSKPALSAAELAQHYYDQAKRKRRGASESSQREGEALSRIERLKQILLQVESPLQNDALLKLETELGLTLQTAPLSERNKRLGGETPGKTFVSREGWPILVGRNKKENLALTLQFARGNDVWLHLRAKPGAHVVVPVPPGKSVPLETLLDAANLVIHYSGGAEWGKTEVDYTYRKFVKRIPKSDEVSYTQAKALSITPDSERLTRLLADKS